MHLLFEDLLSDKFVELMVLRGKAFHHGSAYKLLEQDWFDIRKRLLGFWTPKQRTVIKLKQSTVMQQTSDDVKDSQNGETTHADEKHSNEVKGEESYDDGEIVDEENVLEIWLPGIAMYMFCILFTKLAVLYRSNHAYLQSSRSI